jgi:heat shock protein HslJ
VAPRDPAPYKAAMSTRIRSRPVLLALTLGACASTAPTVPTLDQLLGSWHLAGVQIPVGARAPSLTFGDGGAISGNAGVNQYRGTVDAQALQQGRWQAGPVAATRMAGSQEAMALEAGFLQALAGAREVALQDGMLELKSGDQVLLRFEPLRVR